MNNDQSEAAQWIDREIGPYRVRRLLGEGAFGAVYEAVKQPLGKRVALKLLHRRWSSDTHITARFLQEARAAASLRHPHIVDVDDVGAFEGSPWIAMEFLDGESLAERLHRGGAMSVELAIDTLLPVFSAVAAIHEQGIIHRDLKLENVQLWRSSTGVEHPKLLDFGIAKVAAASQHMSLTGATDVMGTPEYMAPEQWRSAKNVDPASDQWALAVMLYVLLTDVSPFSGDSPQSVMFRVSVEPPPPFEGALAEERDLEAVLRRALEKDPHDRFANVRAFAAALLPFASEGTRQRWSAEFSNRSQTTIDPQREYATSSNTVVARPRAVPVAQDSLVATSTSVAVRSRPRAAPAFVALGALVALSLASVSWMRASRPPTRAAAQSAAPPSAIALDAPPPTGVTAPALIRARESAATPTPVVSTATAAVPLAPTAVAPARAASRPASRRARDATHGQAPGAATTLDTPNI